MKMSSSRLALGLVLLAAPAFAQMQSTPVTRGGWIISGSASFNQSRDDITEQTQTSVGASPTALMFVRSRLAVGAALSLGYSKVGSSHSSSYGLGPSARFYLGDTAAKWLSFFGASVFPQWGSTKSTAFVNGVSTPVEGNQSGIAFDGSFGVTRMLVSHVGATGEAYYARFDRTSKTNGTSRDFTVNSFGARFGLSVFLY